MDLVFIGGSLRSDSLNRRLMGFLARKVEGMGHHAHLFQGDDLRLPLYEDGLASPDAVIAMAEALKGAQGVVFVSPEYNAGIPGHLKNAVDWLSVQQPSPWSGLPALLCAASPGAFGGARGLIPWRATLANLGCWVAPGAIVVPKAHESLGEDGTPTETRTIQEIRRNLEAFLQAAQRLRG